MPTCASADLQRANARNTYAWFLTESNITQCEMLFTVASVMKASDVVLIYSDDTYGKSFYDWFAFFATEHSINIAGEGTLAYQSGMDITPFMESIVHQHEGKKIVVFLALSDVNDYEPVDKTIYEYNIEKMDELPSDESFKMVSITTDTSLDAMIAEGHTHKNFDYGISPVGSVSYGFPQTYEARYGHRPYTGEAQVYDALSLIALGAAHRLSSPDDINVDVDANGQANSPGLTDHIRTVVASEQGTTVGWTERGLYTAFSRLTNKQDIVVTGAIGNLFFDHDTYTKVLNTTYMWWLLNVRLTDDLKVFNEAKPMLYLSTAGQGNETSSTSLWKLQKHFEQVFDRGEIVTHDLPPVTDHWAVVISPSTTWNNYRHQADAFAMYQTLRSHGYDDDHIVLIVEDNLAADSRNNYPGQIFVEPPGDPGISGDSGYDVRQNAVVDYHFSQLHTEDLEDILMGHQSERLPHVIHSDSASNVFVFWSGHGGSKDGPLWGNEDTREYFGTDHLKGIVSRMSGKGADVGTIDRKKYRRLMLCLETCYSGQWGEALLGLPDVVVLTAANSRETSKADVFDQQMGVFLSNAFTRTFRRMVNDDPAMTFYDLYRQLSRTTNGSHVTLYNENQYGSVYTSTMDDFFPR
jgi:glycosylphosphatidylinositol transamidase (GPIT) subunit GPI8